ncbi:MAG: acyl-CoA dehydrogenase [Stenotrophomonas nitritireducens]|uniref:acyl-CoA dehydrogenase n=1 Tax=Stenotrophomonas nitritireducens TaxID=83617 RepID=UPI001AC64090|nr:acyl-CoA dehydrogenase [Stenotrophomonas nitritireducens]MBN8792453.1 acyl-CoA dehydrogenase [Stenotrophomonas nitritireducens]MBN8796858.1 acyl-CoA dehydrogenase [Stenotrophomonas nitritireducens]
MGTALLDRRDLDFLLFDWLGIEALFARPHYAEHSRDTVAAVLDLSERLAADAFLPALRASDRSEPALTADGVALAPEVTAAVRDYIDAGLLAGPFGQDVGGLQLPQLLHYASIGQFMAASLAVAAYPMLTIANARLLAAFGNAAQVEAFALPQIRGQALGTMCLSEPQAGSSLADIRTLALPDGEDALGARHRLHGNKMWISAGDHDITGDIVHLVLARTPGADGKPLPGIKGISLFVVPKHLPDGQANDIAVAGLNHKMGYRGTSNCLLNFGEGQHAPDGAGGAIGWRIGEAGEGLAQMFHMMNEARTGVGLGAAAAGCRGHLLSVEYARGRVQGRIAEGGTTRPAAIIEHADVKHMLLAQKAYAEGALALVLYAARLLDDQLSGDAGTAADAGRLLDLLTPVVKAWPSEYGLAANDLAIQIHGGYGYTRDYDVEQLYRDNRLNPIHEGTTGIQGLDLLGRKVLRDGGAGVAQLRARVEATVAASAADARLAPLARQLEATWQRLGAVVAELASAPAPQALEQATSFLRAFGHAVVGWLWLDMARLCAGDTAFHRGKRAAARWFFAHELPRAALWLDLAATRDDLIASTTQDCFHC